MNTLICIGAGPTNLSLARLIQGHADIVILEKRKTVAWHPGLLMDDSDLQVSHFKDLVTLSDPTSPFTFINFLFASGRIFHFLNAQFSAIPRQEFSQYLEWVASKIACVAFDQPVESIAVGGGAFQVTTATARYSTTHISVGIGQTPRIPAVFREVARKAHAVEYLGAKKRLTPEMNIAVLGGGQSALEVFLDLQRSGHRHVKMLSRRENLFPLDDSPFVNDWFAPAFVKMFYELPSESRQDLLNAQKYSSDGASMSSLRRVYQEIYRNRFHKANQQHLKIETNVKIKDVVPLADGGCTIFWSTPFQQRKEAFDFVFLATGFEKSFPEVLSPIAPDLVFEGCEPCLNFDYSLVSRIPLPGKIFLQNAAKQSHGIADPNLSLVAWRNALIVNSILGCEVYRQPDQFVALF